jgi:hypothetical protein
MREKLIAELVKTFPNDLTLIRPSRRWRAQFKFQDGPTFSLQVAKLQFRSKYVNRWRIIPVPTERQNVTLLARLNSTNDGFHDLWVVPSVANSNSGIFLAEHDLWLHRGKRVEDFARLPEIIRQFEGASIMGRSKLERPGSTTKDAQFI